MKIVRYQTANGQIAYGRLHADGRYAEAGEIFRALVEREAAANQGGPRLSEYLINQALQYSNQGNYPAADSLFARAATASAALGSSLLMGTAISLGGAYGASS